MTNINGKAYAMNAITPMKWWKTPFLRLIFFLLGAIKPLQNDLKNLSFIHFARWVIIPRGGFPRLSEKQPSESLHYDYLLFFSNFNGTWNQYIDAFSAVLSKGLDLIWRWSEKYPASSSIRITTTTPIRSRRRMTSKRPTGCRTRCTILRRTALRFRPPSSRRLT